MTRGVVLHLDSRKLKILELIIKMYIQSGEPVGSKTISKLLQNSISSATIRNEMAELYELGFLEQPYTSSGRVPSQLGYRLYIDQIMERKSLSENQTKQIESWFNVKDPNYSVLIKNAGKMLSQITMCMTVLSSMVFESLIITKIEILEVANQTLAIVVLTSSGIIKSKVCKVDFNLNINTLDFIYRFVNDIFSGKSVEKISQNYINSLVSSLDDYHIFFTPILYTVYEMCSGLNTSNFYIDGQVNLLLYKELKDVVADIVRIFGNEDNIIKIINNQLSKLGNNYRPGVANVSLGRELNNESLVNICLIISKYNIGSIGTGNILVVGPDRLDYAGLVPLVEYFSKMLSLVLSESLKIT